MEYYSGKLIIHNETDVYDCAKLNKLGHVLTMKYSVNFNREKLYLSNVLVKQFLSSRAVQKYILSSCKSYMADNESAICESIKKIYTIENEPKIEITAIGKYFYIKFYCGRNHNIEQLLESLNRKFANKKTIEEILRGQ